VVGLCVSYEAAVAGLCVRYEAAVADFVHLEFV
jgi:hypothetical protein